MKWDANADQKILMFLVDSGVKIVSQELADHLGCTPKALTHHFANLRKKVKEASESTGASGEDESLKPATTKRKRGPSKKSATEGSVKKRKTTKVAKVEEDSDASLPDDAEKVAMGNGFDDDDY